MNTAVSIVVLSLLLGLVPAVAPAAESRPVATVGRGEGYEDALVAFTRGEYRASLIHLRNVLQQEPRHLPSRILLGRVHLALGDPAGAEHELRQAMDAGADPALVVEDLGEALLVRGRYQALLDSIRPDGLGAPQAARVLVLRGKAEMGLERMPQAEDAFAEAALLDPAAATPLLGTAHVQVLRGRAREASALVETARRREPDNAEVAFLDGQLRGAEGDLAGAAAAYGRALAIAPTHIPARLARAAVLLDLGQEQDAGVDLTRVLERYPDEPTAAYLGALLAARRGETDQAREYLDRVERGLQALGEKGLSSQGPALLLAGVVAHVRGRHEAARVYLSTYLERNPGHTGAVARLAAIQIEAGRPNDALALLRPALDHNPGDAALLALNGRALLAKGLYGQAVEVLERAFARDDPDPGAALPLAQGYLGIRDEGRALALLEDAFAHREPNRDAGLLLGLLRLRAGDARAAAGIAARMIAQAQDDPTAHWLRGLAEGALDRPGEARRALERCLALDPGFLPAQVGLARLDRVQGDFQGAAARLDRILEHAPGHLPTLLELTVLEQARGDLPGAIEVAREIQRHGPVDSRYSLRLVELLLSAGDPDEAVGVSASLQQRYPGDLRVLVWSGRAELASGRKEDARRTFRELSTAAGYDPPRLTEAARLQEEAGDLPGAYWSLFKAAEADPGQLAIQARLVRMGIRIGKFDEVLPRVEGLRERHGAEAVTHLLLGEVYEGQGRPADAEAAYRGALEGGSSREAVLRLSLLLARQDRADEALAGLQAWIDVHPDDRAMARVRADLLLGTGRAADAVAVYEPLTDRYADDARFWNNLAVAYLALGDGRALAAAERAYGLAPGDPAVADTLGWVFVNQGRAADGLVFLREAQSRAAGDPEIRYHLARALDDLGRGEEARRELERVRQTPGDFPGRAEALRMLERSGPAGDARAGANRLSARSAEKPVVD